MLSNEIIKKLRKVQADKQRKSKKTISFSRVIEHCIATKKKFHVNNHINKIRLTITIDSERLKKLRNMQADKQEKSEKTVFFSGMIEDMLTV